MSTSTQVMELFNIFSKTFGKEEAQIIVKDIETIIDSRKEELATKSDIQKLDTKLSGDIQKLDTRLSEVELRLTKEIEKIKSSTIKWVVGLLIAQTGMTFTLIVSLLK